MLFLLCSIAFAAWEKFRYGPSKHVKDGIVNYPSSSADTSLNSRGFVAFHFETPSGSTRAKSLLDQCL